ncbi:chemotaxis protein CheX [Rubripirellula tenax]|uniref:chemotaxis protein CheX n=1 Tax=Rubripirellula tenax TaxID=2528015 RepID=UPI001647EB3E|nr:chemotaxis protein CheX [Rubripirellula tenax]
MIKAFQESTFDVFKTMLNVEVTSDDAVPSNQQIFCSVSGTIGLTGSIAGDVIVCLDESLAMHVTGAMLGQAYTEIDDDVIDAVGELTNMIAGSAKGRLEQYDLSLALPTVILGAGHRIGFRQGIMPMKIPFTCEWGTFSIKLGLVEAKTPQPIG